MWLIETFRLCLFFTLQLEIYDFPCDIFVHLIKTFGNLQKKICNRLKYTGYVVAVFSILIELDHGKIKFIVNMTV